MKKLPHEFLERMKSLLGDGYNDFLSSYDLLPVKAFRVNTDKISLSDFEKSILSVMKKFPTLKTDFI